MKKCLLTLSILLANSVYSTAIRIEPEDTYLSYNETATVSITAEDVSCLWGAEIELSFPEDKLALQSITQGSFFKGEGDIFISGTKSGYVFIDAVKWAAGESGTGTIAFITFLCIANNPKGSLTLSKVILAGTETEIPVDVIRSGYIHPVFFEGQKELGNVLIYPNPWRGDRDYEKPYIEFEMPRDSRLSIYTISGRLINEFESPSGFVKWKLDDKNGGPVSSGIYIYWIRSGDKKKIGKLGVIR